MFTEAASPLFWELFTAASKAAHTYDCGDIPAV